MFLFATLNATIAYADAWAEERSVCNWFTKRFVSFASVKTCSAIFNDVCSERHSHCYDAYSKCDYRYPPFPQNSYAEAIATFGNLYSYHYGNNGYCTGYDITYRVPTSNFPMVEGTNAGTKEIKLVIGKTTFDYANNAIILENINGTLSIKDALDKANIFASFVIALSYDKDNDGKSLHELDDETYKSRLLWSTKAILNNGLIKMTGGYEEQVAKSANDRTPFFRSNDFIIDKKEGKAHLKVDKYIIPLPKEVDLDKVVIGVGIDGGNLGLGISEKFSVEQAKSSLQIGEFYTPTEVFSFSNYPNPITDKTTIAIKLSANEKVNLVLYDKNGNVVKSFFNTEVKKDEMFSQEIDLSDLKKDVYFLKLILKDKTLVRKLFIN